MSAKKEKKTMKKLAKLFMIAAVSAVAFMFSGCKSVPSTDSMYAISSSIGKTAGLAVELSKASQEVKDGIVKVLDIASATVPATNETFVAKWTPIIETEVQKLIDNGKVTAEEGKVIKHAMYVACEGIDLIFIRYPVAKQYKELVSAAVDGFCTGFKSVITTTFAVSPDFDQEAYTYLKMKSAMYKAE